MAELVSQEEVYEALRTVYDPEIPIDLWSLGLIYDISIDEIDEKKSDVNITMTLTTPGCGMADHIANDLKNKLLGIDEVSDVYIDITFNPPWEASMMTEKAKEILGLSKNNNDENNNWE